MHLDSAAGPLGGHGAMMRYAPIVAASGASQWIAAAAAALLMEEWDSFG